MHQVHRGGGRNSLGATLLGLLSPRVFLSILLGFGAAGMFLRPLAHWPAALLFVLAAISGWGFEKLIFAPLVGTPARVCLAPGGDP